jgi:hypothetical protein
LCYLAVVAVDWLVAGVVVVGGLWWVEGVQLIVGVICVGVGVDLGGGVGRGREGRWVVAVVMVVRGRSSN